MTPARLRVCRQLLGAFALAGLLACPGCQPFDRYDHSLEQPVPAPIEPPRELAKICLPAYQIEPPDLLQIEVIKLVPKPPYHIEVYDVLQIQVVGTLPEEPIDGFYLLEGEGTINLGPAYGTVRVAGMTITQATAAVTEQLRQVLREPVVSVQLARTAGTQPISGVYLVGPDGTINLRTYGVVHVSGKTLAEARAAVEKRLGESFDNPEVTVDMAGYNSKVYYIITEGASLGDNVVRVPVTGNETVLDAVTQIGGLSQLSSKRMWVARPAPHGFGCEQILPIDWVAITRGGETGTNYQLLPGDRLFVQEDKLSALNNYLVKLTSPIERMFGVTGVGVATIRGTQTMGRNYNRQRNI